MNRDELAANPAASERVVHDLNVDPTLPFADDSFDAVVCCVSVDYLVRPIEVFRDVRRVLRPGGPFVCTFSNRLFPTKAIRGWLATDDEAALRDRRRLLPSSRRLDRSDRRASDAHHPAGRSALRGLRLAPSLGRRAGLRRLGRRVGGAPSRCPSVLDEVLEAALVDELGSDYRHAHPRAVHPRDEVPLTRQQLLRPDMRTRTSATERPATSATATRGCANQLDVWSATPTCRTMPRRRCSSRSTAAPGRWAQKEGQAEPLMAHLAERGWVCVTANYRLSPSATWPDHIVDVKRALACRRRRRSRSTAATPTSW